MSFKNKFDKEKAIEVLLYLSEKSTDIYSVLKTLYFADKEHLSKYGRFICGDSYVAMRLGPVPSGTYDLVKHARGDGCCSICDDAITKVLSVDDRTISPLRKANLSLLSESDIECLDTAIKNYIHLSFNKLKTLSHDSAYKASDKNDFIPLEAIIKTLPNSDSLLSYIQDC